jgi:hypothetical protein
MSARSSSHGHGGSPSRPWPDPTMVPTATGSAAPTNTSAARISPLPEGPHSVPQDSSHDHRRRPPYRLTSAGRAGSPRLT